MTNQLILISGYPRAGKTHRSRQLETHIESTLSQNPDPRARKVKTLHISDDTLGISRTCYENARDEKIARASFSSAIERALSRDTIVIADGMNYIKGFRYQLYCEAKAVSTPSCVLHVGTSPEICRQRNVNEEYPTPVFENLIQRYEEPNGMVRWDAPLFTVLDEDPEPPCARILEAMLPWLLQSDGGADAKPVKPHLATVLRPPSKTDWLQQVDRAASQVLDRLAEWMSDHAGEAGEVGVLGVDAPVEVPVEMPGGGIVSRAVLLRLKRQFIALNRDHDLASIGHVKRLFVDYLNDSFR